MKTTAARRLGWFNLVLVFLQASALSQPSAEPALQPILSRLARQSQEARQHGQAFVAGREGWLFLASELEALGRPGAGELEAARLAILDFHRQLQSAGIALLLVPVPAKAAVYPDKLEGISGARLPRLDSDLANFYGSLRGQGLEVVDLLPLFLRHRKGPQGPLYCRTDSHWSGAGLELAAREIAAGIRRQPWLADLPRREFLQQRNRITIQGDLALLARASNPDRESLPLTFVRDARGSKGGPIPPERHSPVLLMGDSHCLVFHDPSLHAAGAGLPDHLALQLGFAVDLLSVRGSGANTVRLALRRRGDNLKGKRLVIWCLSAREFTQAPGGWKRIPVLNSSRKGSETQRPAGAKDRLFCLSAPLRLYVKPPGETR